jgi:hypothetical protein
MKHPPVILIFLVPADAEQRDWEAALRKLPECSGTDRNQNNAVQPEPNNADKQLLWTWFLPNPSP